MCTKINIPSADLNIKWNEYPMLITTIYFVRKFKLKCSRSVGSTQYVSERPELLIQAR